MADRVVEKAQRLVDGRVVIGRVDVVQIDVVGCQALKTHVEGPPHVQSAGAPIVRALAHFVAALGGKHDAIAAVGQRFTGDPLRFAGRVHVGRIDKVDAQIERLVNDANRIGFGRLRAKHHRAQAQRRDANAGAAK